jgi:hypothetical protein
MKEKIKNVKKTLRKKLNRDFWIKLVIIISSVILIATSFLPYIL